MSQSLVHHKQRHLLPPPRLRAGGGRFDPAGRLRDVRAVPLRGETVRGEGEEDGDEGNSIARLQSEGDEA